MAFNARQRNPLIDSDWQQFIKRRSKELFGLLLLSTATALGMLLFSYSPKDPGLFSVTGEPIRNLLGPKGAAVASPLMITIGFASWTIVAFLVAWGVRFATHCGEDRFLHRLVFLPMLVVATSLLLATQGEMPFWHHQFGAGGMFGDTILGAIIYAWPGNRQTGIQIATSGFWALVAVFAPLVLGITTGEVRQALTAPLSVPRRLLARRGMEAHRSRHRKTADRGLTPQFAKPEAPQEAPPGGKSEVPSGMALQMQQSDANLREGFPLDEFMEDSPRKRIGFGRFARRVASAGRRLAAGGLGVRDSNSVSPATARRSGRQPPLTRSRSAAQEAELQTPEVEAHKPHVRVPASKPPKQSRKAQRENRPRLPIEEAPSGYEGPPLSVLQDPIQVVATNQSSTALESNARMLESSLEDYRVMGKIETVRPGPVVTLYELAPAPGTKAARVISLSDDIARSMCALSARISTVPGRSVIGIELPNHQRETVYLKELLSTREFGDSRMALPIALGKDISGDPFVVDLASMPHMLIAGTTGSGKSVGINTMILSLLYRLSPDDCRFIMVDPKMLELSVYDGIPHLLAPVVTDPKKAVVALKWVVAEMEERYRLMSKMGVRNIGGYNNKVHDALARGEKLTRTVATGFDQETGEQIFETEEFEPKTLPFIVVIVDEMADLMMVAGKDIEACIQRLAQMARASGIHLIMATQRPSVDVITGTIKANFPTRVSFEVSSKVDSRTILGEQGAEQLLGKGDMLYMSGGGKITRVHGPFVSDEEVEQVVNHLLATGRPEYLTEIIEGPDEATAAERDQMLGLSSDGSSDNEEYDKAVAIVLRDRKCSTSYIQRRLEIGYNKAARLVERMEEEGLVSPANHVGKREILVPE